MIRATPQTRKRDPSIALINIVFLMLVFFLIAGTIAAPLDPDLKLVETAELEGREPPDALVLRADGTLSFRGDETNVEAYMQIHADGPVRIVPDRNANGLRMMEISRALRTSGASSVILVTERSLE
ncbi:biopolymer transporter ExbD [uncultured Tateyamaria sp.]|uniref:ExbD/TolR family protein n=1 Tax=uncultured Tateyamaria sp. TaxID=455651 RepID=UPI00262F8F90|nr:biopolymer transporter ExbD [uncultured Tateyamaria sp.]